METAFRKIGVHIPTILLPKSGVDLQKWCVVACDQYTSQPEYWADVEDYVGDEPSTLHLVFPEVYLDARGKEVRIQGISSNMRSYLEKGILTPLKRGFVFVERKTSSGSLRRGLMLTLDLEMYDYEEGAKTILRATEGTVVDRIPPRLKIRRDASVETSHILVLIDDPGKTVIEPIAQCVDERDMVYDVDLMMEAGSVRGYAVHSDILLKQIYGALRELADPGAFVKRYSVGEEEPVLLYAVGDGNHSLATAKAHWDSVKSDLSPEERGHHPARFALVELVNVHDEGLSFEPIHRVVFNVRPEDLLEDFALYWRDRGCEVTVNSFDVGDSASAIGVIGAGIHAIHFAYEGRRGVISVENPRHHMEVGTLQEFLNHLEGTAEGVKVDYVHGRDVVESLARSPGNVGFLLPAMDKHELFKTVISEGVLPRKAFSMGNADEKRFYLECRKIVP